MAQLRRSFDIRLMAAGARPGTQSAEQALANLPVSRRARAGRKRHVRRGRMRAPMGGAPRPSLTATIDASAARRRTHANACASIVPTGGICRGRLGRKLGCGSPPPRGASHLPRCAAGPRALRDYGLLAHHWCGPPQPAPLGRGWKGARARRSRPWARVLFAWARVLCRAAKGEPTCTAVTQRPPAETTLKPAASHCQRDSWPGTPSPPRDPRPAIL